MPDFMPGIVRYEIGVLLKELDKNEELVKVFLYEKTRHAEIWLINEWLNSTTHLLELRESSAEYREEMFRREEQARIEHERAERILNYLVTRLNMPRDSTTTHRFVRLLIKAIDANMREILDQFPGLL